MLCKIQTPTPIQVESSQVENDNNNDYKQSKSQEAI